MSRPIPHLRWGVAALLCLASELNYLDRQTLSVLAATIQADLGLTDVDYSRVTSAFLMTYTVMYAVAGRLEFGSINSLRLTSGTPVPKRRWRTRSRITARSRHQDVALWRSWSSSFQRRRLAGMLRFATRSPMWGQYLGKNSRQSHFGILIGTSS